MNLNIISKVTKDIDKIRYKVHEELAQLFELKKKKKSLINYEALKCYPILAETVRFKKIDT